MSFEDFQHLARLYVVGALDEEEVLAFLCCHGWGLRGEMVSGEVVSVALSAWSGRRMNARSVTVRREWGVGSGE